MKGSQLDAAEVEKRFKTYLKVEARLDSLIRARIFAQPRIKAPPKLAKFVQTYQPNAPAQYEESEIEALVKDTKDFNYDMIEAKEALEGVETAVDGQARLPTRDSPAFSSSKELLDHLSSGCTKIDKTMTSIKMPKPGGKPEVALKDIYAAASALITVAVVVEAVARKAKTLFEDRKKESG